MSDEKERRPRRAQTQTERDLEGLARLREERRRQQAAPAVPVGEFEEIDTGMTERIESDSDMALLFAKNERLKRAMLVQKQDTANMLLEVAGERPPEQRFAVVEKKLRFAYWILSAILIPVIMSLVLAAKYVYTRGGRDAKIEIEHTRMVDDVNELKRQNIEQGQELTEALELTRRNAQRIDDLLRAKSTPPQPARAPTRSPRAPAHTMTVSPQPTQP